MSRIRGSQEEVGPPVDVASSLRDEWNEVGLRGTYVLPMVEDVITMVRTRIRVPMVYLLQHVALLAATPRNADRLRRRARSAGLHRALPLWYVRSTFYRCSVWLH